MRYRRYLAVLFLGLHLTAGCVAPALTTETAAPPALLGKAPAPDPTYAGPSVLDRRIANPSNSYPGATFLNPISTKALALPRLQRRNVVVGIVFAAAILLAMVWITNGDGGRAGCPPVC